MDKQWNASIMDSIVVSFRIASELGNSDDWRWRYRKGKWLGQILEHANLGFCDGGGQGFGQLDITFFVNDIDRAVDALIAALVAEDLINWATIKSSPNKSGVWKTHHVGTNGPITLCPTTNTELQAILDAADETLNDTDDPEDASGDDSSE